MRSVECASCIARQIARGKRAATADTRVLAPALSQVQDRLQMERANGYGVWSPVVQMERTNGTVVHMVDYTRL